MADLVAALRYDPFADDRDVGEWVVFRDKLVTRRTTSWCHMCGGDVERGTTARVMVAKFDGEVVTYRWCEGCCLAMARDVRDGDCLHTERRYRLRRRPAALRGNDRWEYCLE